MPMSGSIDVGDVIPEGAGPVNSWRFRSFCLSRRFVSALM
jgi:hypothetical protein